MMSAPPKGPLKFLRWFCREAYLDEVEGNILELYNRECQQSPGKAKRHLTWNVIRHLRPEFVKPLRFPDLTNSPAMFRNYLKTGMRNLLKHKFFSFISITGLAIG